MREITFTSNPPARRRPVSGRTGMPYFGHKISTRQTDVVPPERPPAKPSFLPAVKRFFGRVGRFFSNIVTRILEKLGMTSSTKSPNKIYSFGTSGYRNDTEEGFNDAVVRQITRAIGDYLITGMKETGKPLPVLIGGDTREKTRRFIPVIADLLKDRGLDVYQAENDVPSPVLAYAAKHASELGIGVKETAGAILMTASHNPWPYGGYNFLTPDAAVAPSHVSKQFEAYQKAPAHQSLDRDGNIRTFDPYAIYKRHLKEGIGIDFDKIKASGVTIFYDPLYATGRRYLPRILQEEGIPVTAIHDTDERPPGYTGMPEPSAENLKELAGLIKEDGSRLKVGLSNDGDSDRFGVLDENGDFVNPNDVLALALYHLIKNRKESGVVVRSQATTHLLDELARQHGLSVEQTPVGYKYIAEEFIEREEKGETPVLIGGESSGGLSIKGHIPEKDGILTNLLVAELVATENKPLSEILANLKQQVARQYVFRELSVKTNAKSRILEDFQQLADQGGQLGGVAVDLEQSKQAAAALVNKYKTRDGAKLYLADGSWVLIRASGTEPLVRVYAEGSGANGEEAQQKADQLLDAVRHILTDHYNIPGSAIKQKL